MREAALVGEAQRTSQFLVFARAAGFWFSPFCFFFFPSLEDLIQISAT
jgi:hypothetical protein